MKAFLLGVRAHEPFPLQARMLMDSVLCRSRTGNHGCSELMSTMVIACLKDMFLSAARQPLALTIFMFSYRLTFIFKILCIHGCVYAGGYAYMTVGGVVCKMCMLEGMHT